MRALAIFLGVAALALVAAALPGVLGWGGREDKTAWRE